LFSELKPGDLVNLEVDPIARQVARVLESMMSSGRWQPTSGTDLVAYASPMRMRLGPEVQS
jgi:hypothetical protein